MFLFFCFYKKNLLKWGYVVMYQQTQALVRNICSISWWNRQEYCRYFTLGWQQLVNFELTHPHSMCVVVVFFCFCFVNQHTFIYHLSCSLSLSLWNLFNSFLFINPFPLSLFYLFPAFDSITTTSFPLLI